ncbi:hypothetical protein OH77DRAFT_1419555 [Trametes cingulata]|nr:hypothetical protein OH77DRAFT_1419555 [Trametes cingulata]
MDRLHDHHQSYSWHQSHDQATVLLLLPYDTVEDDVSVIIEDEYLVAGVLGQPPVVKGKLYGKVDTSASVWQLEPRTSRLSHRERTTSTASSGSTQSSYAFVSEPEISSSFAASLEAGLVSGSDADSAVLSSPALSSPISSSIDEHLSSSGYDSRHQPQRRSRLSVSPPARQPQLQRISQVSSYSSLESLHTGAGRLLTIHLEKAESVIWPSLIVGPVPDSVSPVPSGVYPWTTSVTEEAKYNMDPTSLALIALDLYDIRKAKEDAFEYFVRAWHQAHLPSAAIRLATHYLPLQTLIPDSSEAAPDSPTSSVVTVSAKGTRSKHASSAPPAQLPTLTPSTSASSSSAFDSALQLSSVPPPRPAPLLTISPGTEEYYLARLGGAPGLAQLFLAAGLLHLEGTATSLLASSFSGLSALRAPFAVSGPGPSSTSPGAHGPGGGGAGVDAWRRDREQAALFFKRARSLSPTLDIPLLPAEPESEYNSGAESGNGDGESGSGGRVSSPAQSQSSSQPRVQGQRAAAASSSNAEQRPQRTQRRRGDRERERHARTTAQLEMPTLDVRRPPSAASSHAPLPPIPSVRRRRPARSRSRSRQVLGRGEEDDDGDLSSSLLESVHAEPTDLGSATGEDDRTWYLYIPGLVGAGTALLVVGLLSLQSWRKNQG